MVESFGYQSMDSENKYNFSKWIIQSQEQTYIVSKNWLFFAGTMKAAYELMQAMKAEVVECMVVIELPDLKGRDKIPTNLYSLVQFEGD